MVTEPTSTVRARRLRERRSRGVAMVAPVEVGDELVDARTGKNSQHAMAELPDKTVTTVLPTTGVREHAPGNFGQSDRIIQFPVRQQPRIGSDLGTVELNLEPAVKIQPQNPCFPFTHRVSHINTPSPPITS